VREFASKDFGGKIVPLFAAERTPGHNPCIRHGADRRWDVLTALLAADGEIAPPSFRKVEHKEQYRRTKDETSIVHIVEFGPAEPTGA